jgi:hypothetical protein
VGFLNLLHIFVFRASTRTWSYSSLKEWENDDADNAGAALPETEA